MEAVYQYKAHLPGMPKSYQLHETKANPYQSGDQVYVKPSNARCHAFWKTGGMTKVVVDNVVEVNGITCHVVDMRCAGSCGE